MSNFANFRKVTKKFPQVHSCSKPSLLHSQTCDGDPRVSILELLDGVANTQQTLNPSTDVLELGKSRFNYDTVMNHLFNASALCKEEFVRLLLRLVVWWFYPPRLRLKKMKQEKKPAYSQLGKAATELKLLTAQNRVSKYFCQQFDTLKADKRHPHHILLKMYTQTYVIYNVNKCLENQFC